MKNIIEVKEEVRVGNVILEAGDRIEIMEENIKIVEDFLKSLNELQRSGTRLRSASKYVHPSTYNKVISLLSELNDLEDTIRYDVENYVKSDF